MLLLGGRRCPDFRMRRLLLISPQAIDACPRAAVRSRPPPPTVSATPRCALPRLAMSWSLGLGLTGVFASAPPRGTGTIRTTAFTLVEHANGTATLTINPDVLLEPSTLQSDLQQDGIPAMVTTGSFCSSHPAPAGFRRVVTEQRSSPDTMTINPAAMPAGAELSFGHFKLGSAQETAVALIDTNPCACSNVAPHAPRNGDTVVHDLPWGPNAR